MQAASLFVGHDALGSGNDGDAKTLQNLRHIFNAGVNAQTRFGNTAETGDSRFLVLAVFQRNADDALRAVVDELEVFDISFAEQDLSNGLFGIGSRNIDRFVVIRARVANSRQQYLILVPDLSLQVTEFATPDTDNWTT